MRRSHAPQKLGDVLGQLIRSMGIEGPLARGAVITKWESILGEKMMQHVDKSWMRGDKLYVRVSSSAWRHELHLQREQWRLRLNQEVGSDAVREIIFR